MPRMIEQALASAHDGCWWATALQLELALSESVCARLVDVGVISASGPDAATFLNGQLTVDTQKLGPGQWQLGACCSQKGRVLAIIEVCRAGEDFLLWMPSDRVGPTLARLSRFVLRAKVRLQDASDQWQLWGLTGPGAQASLVRAGFECPQAPWTVTRPREGELLSRLPPSPSAGPRFLLALSARAGGSHRQPPPGFSEVASGVWWWSKVDAGLPDVFAATEERFVPQALNLDVLGGVHFGKGCYTGQEVVARSQYLGKLRRRMVRGHAPRARAGEDLLANDEAGAVCGTVVMAAASPRGGCDLLLECPTDLARPGGLRLADRPTGELAIEPVPYPIIDPTA
jgi:tRNA-modifying protein YgfZ